jgi:hypothetical protein
MKLKAALHTDGASNISDCGNQNVNIEGLELHRRREFIYSLMALDSGTPSGAKGEHSSYRVKPDVLEELFRHVMLRAVFGEKPGSSENVKVGG